MVQSVNQIVPAEDVAVGENSIRLEKCGGPERCEGFIRCFSEASICLGLPTDAVQHDSFAVKAIERAKSEIAMAKNVVDFHASFENPLNQRSGCRDLINRVVIKVQTVSNGLAHEVLDAVSRPFGLLLKRMPQTLSNGKLEGMAAAWVAVLSHGVLING